MSSQEEYSSPRTFYVFMVILGLLGLIVSWATGPTFLLAIPGLSERVAGRVTGYQTMPSLEGPWDVTHAIVQFTDSSNQVRAIWGRGHLSGEVSIRYLRLNPDLAMVEGNWFQNINDTIGKSLCVDLPSFALVILGVFLYVAYKR